tara:strand:- start:380 stop:817 length:438 start_codon:yes stop_codon:yes gene_type:complete
MKINVDRMAVLAGISPKSSRRGLHENIQHEMKADSEENEAKENEPTDEAHHDRDPSEMDDVIEIDEVMLVQELRRAKKIMSESKKRNLKERRQEAELKKIIEEEVQSIFGDMNLNSDWVYGNKKPRRSRKGYTHQGSYLKGIGFE